MQTRVDGLRSDLVRSTNFVADHLYPTLNGFYRALTRRWRERACAAIVAGSLDIPTAVRRDTGRAIQPTLWEYWSVPARHHLVENGRYCAYVAWTNGGQEGALTAVRCDGAVGSVVEDWQTTDPRTGTVVTVPPNIDCGVGGILKQVEDWAWAERQAVFSRIQLFDHHDLDVLGTAYDDLVRVGDQMVLNQAVNPDSTEPDLGASPLASVVNQVAARDTWDTGWWTEWTGLLATTVKNGFFASVAPTLNNQSVIAGYLANLYSTRAAIINAGRGNALDAIQRATAALDRTQVVVTHHTGQWKAVQGLGTLVSISGAWSGIGAGVGAALVLVGFVGENLWGESRDGGYAHDIEGVVEQLNREIATLNEEIDGYEQDYHGAVAALLEGVNAVHSFNLELYDHTENDPEGAAEADRVGFSAKIDDIVKVAEGCYRAGDHYADLLPVLAGTAAADRSLAGGDGAPTWADRKLLETRDLFESFLKTTTGRYLVAGDMVKEAADRYSRTDDELRAEFNRLMREWRREDQRPDDVQVPFTPEEYAGETDRHPDLFLGPPAPRRADGGEYRVGPDAGAPE
jgi:hypothetical protein